MLEKKIDNLLELMEKSEKQGQEIKRQSEIERFHKIIGNNYNNLLQPSISLNVIGDYINELELMNINVRINNLLSSLKKISEEMTNEKCLDNSNIYELVNMANVTDSEIKQKWQQYMLIQNKELLDSLNLLENLIDDKVTILKLHYAIRNVGKQWPINKSDIEKYNNGVINSRKLINKLKVTKGISNFLLAVMNGEATLEDLNEEIIDWLKNQKLLGKVKIVYSK